MNKKKVKLVIMIFTALLIFISDAGRVYAEPLMTIRVKASQVEKVGDTVTIQLVLENNPNITTMGLEMQYDSEILTYKSDAWTSELTAGNNNMTLVSDVEDGASKKLNISMVAYDGYTSNGTVVTLTFDVRQEFESLPVTLTVRDITDINLADISPANVAIVIDDNAGISETVDHVETQSDTGNKENDVNNTNPPKYDNTFKTGVIDTQYVFAIIAIGCALLSAFCYKIAKK